MSDQKDTAYQPEDHELTIYELWEKSNAFSPDEESNKPPYVITLPPPNITGNLHMGHALNGTIQDVLIRYHRMLGEPTVWIPGTDHASIATQNVIEKKLRAEGKTRHDIGREKFLEEAWKWKEHYGETIISQLRRLGTSCDWSRTAFTMDEKYNEAVQKAFLEYYRLGYIYRGRRLVNWCPRCTSVISDLEINHEDRDSSLTTIKYPLVDSNVFIEVATTRPETMLGDTAVAVHPDDERYKNFVGKEVALPLTDRKIPIIADDRIDPSFGTGAVKVTPAHDPLDAEIGETHKLPAQNVIGESGQMTEQAGKYQGLSVSEARQAVVAELKKQSLIKEVVSHRHAVATCDRCGTVIEPLLSRQWFVDMSQLKEDTIKAVSSDKIEFHPPRWRQHLIDWMENVHDWTISRQLWWGQRLPVWWKVGTHNSPQEEGNFVVSATPPEEGEWEQDPDVLDTWFSSALWPFATLGWPENTPDLKKYYPTSTLSTARDILYLWVARMIFSGLELMQGEEYGNRSFEERIPFKHVLIHPTVLNKEGRRMSKSLGTGVDPLELIEQYGADAVRFGLMYQMSFDSQAIRFDERDIKTARNFANKIWNISHLLSDLPDSDTSETIADRWIQAATNQLTSEVTQLLQKNQIGEASRLLFDFIWQQYADWYLEILKTGGNSNVAKAVFSDLLKLLHPFMPHITETIFQQRYHTDIEPLLITATWPPSTASEVNNEDGEQMNLFKAIVTATRSARALLNIPPSEVMQIFSSETLPLPAAFSRMCRVEIVEQEAPDMKRFPAGDNYIALAAPAINKQSLEKARQKLTGNLTELEKLAQRQQQILKQMSGKAPSETIAIKQEELTQTEQLISQTKASLSFFDE